MKRSSVLVSAAFLALVTVACTRAPDSSERRSAATTVAPAMTPSATLSPEVARKALPLMIVHKSPTCSCCGLWVEHMRAAGFEVEVSNSENLESIKQRVGVPAGKASCHTAEVGGYFVEGHVPAEDVKRLLAAKPDAKGLVLPGMPAGSPGMEMPDGSHQPYTVELVRGDGRIEEFAKH